jgi:hypothetical protein
MAQTGSEKLKNGDARLAKVKGLAKAMMAKMQLSRLPVEE